MLEHKIKRPPKKSTNVSIRTDLIKIAKDDNINLSNMLEQSLLEYCKKKRQQDWVNENKKAFSDYNRIIEEYGLYADDVRLF